MSNFTLEVVVYIISILLMIISTGLILKKFLMIRNRFYLALLISWLSMLLYLITGALSFYFLSLIQYQLHFIFFIPFSFSIIVCVDFIERYGLDPIKLVIFSVTVTGFFITFFKPDSVSIIELPTGGFTIKGNDESLYWLQLILIEPLILFICYGFQILRKIPKEKRNKAILNLIGSLFSALIAFILNLFRVGEIIPGLPIGLLSIGILISSYAFYSSPEMLEALIKASNKVKYKLLSKILPICANCKKIRDPEGEWTSVEHFFRKHSDISFTHGICSSCEKKLYSDL